MNITIKLSDKEIEAAIRLYMRREGFDVVKFSRSNMSCEVVKRVEKKLFTYDPNFGINHNR